MDRHPLNNHIYDQLRQREKYANATDIKVNDVIDQINGIDIRDILNSRDFDQYKAANPDAKALKYGPEMKRQWRMVLDQVIIPLDDELR